MAYKGNNLMVLNNISEGTRRSIVDFFPVSKISWAGRLRENDFLARLYDLTEMGSNDYRIPNAKGDIVQHRVHWNDWEDDWVFYDDRFNLLYGTGDDFLLFLCETVNSAGRPDTDEARNLVDQYNRILAPDGCSVIEGQQISGKPVFGPERSGQRIQIFDEPTGWEKVDRQIKTAKDQLRTSETEEHFQSVGLVCREVLITVSQAVYDPERHRTRDGVVPSNSDVGRMLAAFFDSELPGGTNEEVKQSRCAFPGRSGGLEAGETGLNAEDAEDAEDYWIGPERAGVGRGRDGGLNVEGAELVLRSGFVRSFC